MQVGGVRRWSQEDENGEVRETEKDSGRSQGEGQPHGECSGGTVEMVGKVADSESTRGAQQVHPDSMEEARGEEGAGLSLDTAVT